MKMRLSVLLALLLVAAGALLLRDQLADDAVLQEPTAFIDPAVLDALQQQPEVEVYISLKEPNIPFAEQTAEVRRQHTAEVQARVLSVLASSDFTLTHQFKLFGLAGRITESGLQKLATHPDVTGIVLPGKGELL